MGDVIEVLTTATNTVEVEAAGPQGIPGVGVPTGGSALQVLRKASGTDYDTEWAAAGAGSGSVTSVALAGTGLSISGSPVTTSGTITANVSYGTTQGTACQGNDARLSDARTPTAHTHGNITNSGAVGTTANLPLKTGTNGVVEAGSFSNTAGSFCAGDDVRLSDARTAVAHAASHTAGSKASFFGTVSGMTGTVWIIANDAGTAGNSITLSFNGTSDIETVLAAWNSANPSNTASVSDYGGSTSQVPSNGQTITLSGGVNAGSDSIADDTTPRFDSLIVGGGQGGAAFNWINSGEHLAHIVCQDGTSQTPLVMFGGSAQFIVFQDHNISSGFAHGLAIPGQPPDGIYRLTLYNGSSWNPKIIVPQTGTIELTENISLKDLDNEFAATFDVQSQLSDDVTLTIPDQSGTLAVVTDIPTTAGDVGAVAAGAITTSGLTQATARILGRTSSSTGAVEEIQIGSGLSLSAGELSATGAGVTAVGASTADVLSVSGSDLVADDPNADRIVFFDDSEGKLRYLEAGSGLSISGTTMTVTATGGATNLWIPASAWIPRTTTGCGVDSRETSTNKQNFDELLFDAGTDEFAQALVIMPSNYNNSTITARFYWTAASGSGDVIWGLQGRAFANDDALDTAHGTAQTATDTLLAADDMHVSAATSAVTIGGTPAANTPIQLQVYRDADAGGDTLAVDARLLGVEIIFN
jgi:hypothetical protein